MKFIGPSSQSFARDYALLAVLATLPLGASAQSTGGKKHRASPTPTAIVPTASSDKAHIRFWKSDLAGVTSTRLNLKLTLANDHNPGATREIASLGRGYQFEDYVDVPAGRCTLEVFLNEQKQPFFNSSVDLSGGSYTTLLLSSPEREGGQPRTELIADASTENVASPTFPAVTAQFSVRNLAPGIHDLRVSVGDNLIAQFTAVGGSLRMTGLRPGVFGVRTTGKDAEGRSFEWTTEANFDRFRRQTLLIYPDPYGRVRPRLSVDGPNASANPARPSDQG